MEDLKKSNNKSGVITLKPRREIVIEELQNEFDKQMDKINLINDFMSLFGKKEEIKGDLTVLRNKTVELKKFLADAREKVHFFKTVQLTQTNQLIDKMREQHLEMLQMLEETEESEEDPVSTNIIGKLNRKVSSFKKQSKLSFIK